MYPFSFSFLSVLCQHESIKRDVLDTRQKLFSILLLLLLLFVIVAVVVALRKLSNERTGRLFQSGYFSLKRRKLGRERI